MPTINPNFDDSSRVSEIINSNTGQTSGRNQQVVSSLRNQPAGGNNNDPNQEIQPTLRGNQTMPQYGTPQWYQWVAQFTGGSNPANFANSAGTSADPDLDPRRRSQDLGEVQANHPGFRLPPVNYNSSDPDAILAQVIKRDQAIYNHFYRPVQQDVIASLNDTSIVDDTREAILSGQADQPARAQRTLRRYGQQMTPIQAAQAERRAAFDQALEFDSGVNEARIDLKERNDSLRRELINIGRGVAGDATSGLGEAAGLQAQREANNRNARAAARAQNYQTAASLASAALLFFAI